VTDLAPIDQIAAVEDGYAGKILERTGHQVVVILVAADAGVGIETGNDGIFIFHWHSRGDGSQSIIAEKREGIFEKLFGVMEIAIPWG
jgi:hypothetical protein